MSKYNLNWQQTDAQLLEALLLATGGEGAAPLHEVLLMADAVDGTVLSHEEVEQGLEKLMSVNYVHVQKNKLSLTPEFMKAYESIDGAENEQEALWQLLQSQLLTPEGLDEPKILIKKYKLKNHYQAYLEQYGGGE
ncbi:hypothetical protein POKO110462_16890 [Pontibacter korlensis]|uniref:Uncharacterized protein n=1 Tax=Pontibacter korlensis TaxID=400092 RepID=A0A0E3UWE5_9BACT|nr:hypothetical protein [Pontibacter korlensis]AKD03337.1 hypothetical protein PKOR_09655 [Pontibacter korlensis]